MKDICSHNIAGFTLQCVYGPSGEFIDVKVDLNIYLQKLQHHHPLENLTVMLSVE